MKKAVIITPFYNYSYNVRIKYIKKYLQNRGYTCEIITSDFDHREKKYYQIDDVGVTAVHVPSYKKNISPQRIYSHFCFAKDARKLTNKIEPELIYASAPPNFLFAFMSGFKKKHPQVKLIYEIGDLWPETLPVSGKFKKIIGPVLGVWSYLRDHFIHHSDGVVYECDLFKNQVDKHHPDVYSETIYLCKEDFFNADFQFETQDDILKFAYLGSVNNIIDIDLIVEFLEAVQIEREIHFTLIGAGERYNELVELCKNRSIPILDYGIVYDDNQKYEILSKCQFGFNIMKDSVVVGATMKSLEYFHWGLVLINNIPADTAKLIDENLCGYNIFEHNYDSTISIISQLSIQEINKKRLLSRKVYEQKFDEKAIAEQFDKFLDMIERGNNER